MSCNCEEGPCIHTRKTIVVYPGGSTLLHGAGTVSEVEREVSEAIDCGHHFLYLHSTRLGTNGFAINPREVIAVISAD